MSTESTVTTHMIFASRVNHLEDVLDYIDQLHSAASDGDSQALTEMNDVEIMNTLRDIIYTAQETIEEIESRKSMRTERKQHPTLRVIPRINKAG